MNTFNTSTETAFPLHPPTIKNHDKGKKKTKLQQCQGPPNPWPCHTSGGIYLWTVNSREDLVITQKEPLQYIKILIVVKEVKKAILLAIKI